MTGTRFDHIPFNRPATTGDELAAIADAIDRGHLSADGVFTERCRSWLESSLGCRPALVVHSCTAALELSALLLDIRPGDEVIMPSYSFVTTATSFVLRGATPVFVDINPETMNVEPELVADALTSKTRAIVPVHYAGVACEMDALSELARAYSVPIIEDAAQGICAGYKGRPLGTLGALGAISFHETKNVTCGQGGVLVVNDSELAERAEVLRDKGTNRSKFVRGEVDKYTWLDVGSSYAITDLAAAFLWPQLQQSANITRERLEIWNAYHDAFADSEAAGLVRRPVVPSTCQHNAHMYYLLLPTRELRDEFIAQLNSANINAVFHYIPLHSSPAGQRYGRAHGTLEATDELSGRLVRLPLWNGMSSTVVDRVVDTIIQVLRGSPRPASVG